MFGSREEYAKIKPTWWYKEHDCPFCLGENDKIYWQWKYWKIIPNKFPYSGDKFHIMAIPIRHVSFAYQLTAEEFSELSEVHNFVKEFFANKEYFSFTRESLWNRSVEHLHMHFLSWILKGKFLRKMLEMQGFPIKQELNLNTYE